MPTYNTEGVVIKRMDFGEADRILTVLSKNKGKITCLAKGVRRLESKKGGHIELLNQVKLGLASGRNLDILTEAEVINSFNNVRESLQKVAWAYHVTELVEYSTPPHQENFSIYNLLLTLLNYLNKEEDRLKVQTYLRAFEIKLLELIGFRPNFITCGQCGRILLPRENSLSPDHGGIICASCKGGLFSLLPQASKKMSPVSPVATPASLWAGRRSFVRPISVEAIKILRFLQDEKWSQVEKLTLVLSLGKEIEQHLKFYWEYILEKELKSSKFVDKVS